jgi:hypothetical protein
MGKPPKNRTRDAVVLSSIALALAVVVSVSAHEQERGIHVPDLAGRAVYQAPTLLGVRGLTLGKVYTGRARALRFRRPCSARCRSQGPSYEPEPRSMSRPAGWKSRLACRPLGSRQSSEASGPKRNRCLHAPGPAYPRPEADKEA